MFFHTLVAYAHTMPLRELAVLRHAIAAAPRYCCHAARFFFELFSRMLDAAMPYAAAAMPLRH